MISSIKKYIRAMLAATIGAAGLALPAKAVCPVCAVTVAAGLGLSRWLGIDDSVSGVWAGGVMMALVIWTINWLNKKNIRFYGRKILTVTVYYTLLIWPLYQWDVIGHPFNKIFGLDKLVVGVIAGSVFFLAGDLAYLYFKNKNGKAYFPFEKVALPVAPLIILSAIFYLLTK